jgi:replicative DNA helicase
MSESGTSQVLGAPEAEMQLLGSGMRNPAWIDDVNVALGPEPWFNPYHAQVWGAICAAYAATGRAGVGEVATQMRANGATLSDEDLRWFYEVEAAGWATESAALSTARMIGQYAKLRRFKAIARRVADQPVNVGDVPIWSEAVMSMFAKAEEGVSYEDAACMGAIINEVVEEMNAVAEGKPPEKTIPYGVSVMDRVTYGGMRAGQLILVAGRPGDGKSAVALSIGLEAAKAKHKVLMFSTEMDNASQGRRALAQMARVEFGSILTSKLDERQWGAVSSARDAAQTLPFWSYDIATMHVARMRALCKSHQRRHGLDLVLIDYAQRLQAGKDEDMDWVRVTKATEACKTIARELEIPVVLLAQLKRANDGKKGRPSLSDLRQSGKLEEEADVIWMLHRDENAEGELVHDREFGIVKQRNGPSVQWYHMHLDPVTFKLTQLADNARASSKPAPVQRRGFGAEVM